MRGSAHGGREQDVVAGEETADDATCAVKHINRHGVVACRELTREFCRSPGDSLDVLRCRRAAQKLLRLQEHGAGLGGNDDRDGLAACRFVDRRRGLFQVVAQTLAQFRRLGDSGDALRIDSVAVPSLGSEGDPEAPGVGPDLHKIGTARRRRPIGVSDVRAGSRVEQCCAIAHRARNGVSAGQSAPPLPEIRAEGNAPARGLQAEQPAATGGDTDGSAAVSAMRHG